MPSVFIVFGSTGEYSDRGEWPVRAYDSQARADAHVAAAAKWCDEHGVGENPNSDLDYEARGELKNPHDPNFKTDYTGTRYYVVACPYGEEAADGR